MNSKKRTLLAIIILFILAAPLQTLGSFAATPPYNEYSMPAPSFKRADLVSSSDGNIWYIRDNEKKIVKVAPNGQITEYDGPHNNVNEIVHYGTLDPVMAEGPDGNMWFGSYESPAGNTWVQHPFLNKITNSGVITSYPLNIPPNTKTDGPYAGVAFGPSSLAKGPDGNMWVTSGAVQQAGYSMILKVDTSGNVLDFWEPQDQRGPFTIVEGPDGNMWFNTYGKISKITTSGQVTAYDAPSTVPPVTKGPDGNMWFMGASENDGWGIYSISTDGQITKRHSIYLTEDIFPEGLGLTFDADGNILYSICTYSEKINDVYNKVNCGITQIDKSGHLLNFYPFPENMYIGTVAKAANDSIWAIAATLDPEAEGSVSDFKLINFYLTDMPTGPVPESPDTITPTVPRTGRLIGAAIVSVSLVTMALLAANEIRRRHNHPGSAR